ncbi:TPA: hypothetical protein DIC38_02160 [Candidatus Nomurabacteria bacterium]|nr:MAG: hypothetical protein O210_OD1C00001G0298 [Parcubacteria bacterium RAAC4_OD1_1]HCY26461.1 hypothetical protein [Candidatus Nomurabacteria bacterium]
MEISLIPIAEADVVSLMGSISKHLLNPLITLLFAIAVAYFIWGAMKFLLNPDNEEVRKTSKNHMLWGIIGLFVMVAVFGIMRFLLNSIGEKNIKIDKDGSYQVGEMY